MGCIQIKKLARGMHLSQEFGPKRRETSSRQLDTHTLNYVLFFLSLHRETSPPTDSLNSHVKCAPLAVRANLTRIHNGLQDGRHQYLNGGFTRARGAAGGGVSGRDWQTGVVDPGSVKPLDTSTGSGGVFCIWLVGQSMERTNKQTVL